MSFSDYLLVHVFTALLPPIDPNERDYYDILGVSRNASLNDIRKAYKIKSLQLHPDKVAQRGEHANADEAAQEYEQVQEAYACLSDRKHRRQYHYALQCSPTRYRFVKSGAFSHPVACLENLSRASCCDKTRLVVVVTLLLGLLLLQPILIAAKVNAITTQSGSLLQDTSWVVILIPLWVFHGLILLGLLVWLVLLSTPEGRGMVFLTLWEQVSWLAGQVLLAKQWDWGAVGAAQLNWHYLSIPFYVALVLRAWKYFVSIRYYQNEQAKMVSPERMEQLLQQQDTTTGEGEGEQGQHQELTEEQRVAQLEREYTVVTVNEEAVAQAAQVLSSSSGTGELLEEDELEFIRVELSPEFQAIEEAKEPLARSMGSILVFGVSFVALVASKLQGQINVSWWTVFVPILTYLGIRWLGSLVLCCCAAVPGDEVIVVGGGAHGNNGDDDDDDDDDDDNNGGDDDNGNAANPQENKELAPKTPENVKASTNWASAEGDMQEFNRPSPVAPKEDVGAQVADTTEQDTSDDNDEEKQSDAGRQQQQQQQQQEADDSAEEQPHIRIDEETFHAWQQAHAQAEQSAMERQAKAQSTCCWVSFQLTIICLIVGKLQQDYRNDDPSQAGYNAFWILFPVFLVFGLTLCCCSCLIYCAGASSQLDDLVERAKPHEEHGNENSGGEDHPSSSQPVPAAHPEAQVSQEPESGPQDSAPQPDLEAGEDINDLD